MSLFTFFSLSLIFTLVATSSSRKRLLLFFLSRSSSFSLWASWPVALLSFFPCLSISLYSKFVDMTINLRLILEKTRIQKQFPLSVFVFIDSLVVSASQDAGGHTLSRQKNQTFGFDLHLVGARTVVRTLRHNQIFCLANFLTHGALLARFAREPRHNTTTWRQGLYYPTEEQTIQHELKKDEHS